MNSRCSIEDEDEGEETTVTFKGCTPLSKAQYDNIDSLVKESKTM